MESFLSLDHLKHRYVLALVMGLFTMVFPTALIAQELDSRATESPIPLSGLPAVTAGPVLYTTDACADLPEDLLKGAYEETAFDGLPIEQLWRQSLPEWAAMCNTHVVGDNGADLELELGCFYPADDWESAVYETVATGSLTDLSRHATAIDYGVPVQALAGYMHVDGFDDAVVLTGMHLEFSSDEGEQLIMFQPLTFPGKETVARWEACKMGHFVPSSAGKLGNELSQWARLAADPPPTGEPDDREPCYCARVSLEKAEAAFSRFRGAVAVCLGVCIGAILGGAGLCAATSVGWLGCFGWVCASAVAVAAGCLAGASYALHANITDIRAWFLECCQTHDCPGYGHP